MTTTASIKQRIWIVPLLIAGLVAVFGWWGNTRLKQMIESELSGDLTTALDANVMALKIWTTNQAKLASSLADEPKTRALAVQILDQFQSAEAERKKADAAAAEELADYLKPRLSKVGYEIAQVVNTNFVVVANSRRGRVRAGLAVPEEHLAKFAELFASGQPVIITPFKPRRPKRSAQRYLFGGGPRILSADRRARFHRRVHSGSL